MSAYVLVYVVTADLEEARRLGRLLVEKRLAGCTNIVPSIESFYWWEGRLVEDRESLLLAKTRHDLVKAVISAIKEAHSYQVPAILAMEVKEGNPDYLAWLNGELERPLDL